ncbi:hypothetical protein BpHYR1_030606 [Brachionus plicatilis]|uniref:Uncharacterized protein n=1 Tax=Brachionus plicatilis TaxID=10195 RepID=A0A3M7Q4K0_BRAPC|nr:hypothetical protein BpHYR1_030606 [Brachionus plicatilis]
MEFYLHKFVLTHLALSAKLANNNLSRKSSSSGICSYFSFYFCNLITENRLGDYETNICSKFVLLTYKREAE